MLQDASRVIELTKYTTAKIEEHQMAKIGGFPRSKRWRCSEGIVLKKAQPGMRRVWMILGLSKNLFVNALVVTDRESNVHCHITSDCDYPNGTETDLSYAQEEEYDDHNGSTEGDSRSLCPAWITSPGEVVI